MARLDDIERKSLSAFSFGNTGWIVPPQVSSRILSCLTDPTDVLSMFSQETISAGSIQYPIDNSEMENVAWACEFECFGPQATIAPPGMMEIKAEELRDGLGKPVGILNPNSGIPGASVYAKITRAKSTIFRSIDAPFVIALRSRQQCRHHCSSLIGDGYIKVLVEELERRQRLTERRLVRQPARALRLE